jgi:hypothetical protein
MFKSANASDIIGTTNRIVNNLMMMGVSAEEARRQLRVFAEDNGLDSFNVGIEALQESYIEFTQRAHDSTLYDDMEFLQDSVVGLAELFKDDFPAGLDVSAIAMRHFTEGAGFDIANFNKDLANSIELFEGIQGALSGGLSGGIADLFNPDSTADYYDVLMSTTHDAIAGGMQTAFSQKLADMPEFAAFNASIGTLIEDTMSGNMAKAVLADLNAVEMNASALIEALGPTLENIAFVADQVNRAFLTSSYGFGDLATTTREDMVEMKRQSVAPVDQMAFLRGQIAEQKRAYETATTDWERRTALDELHALGIELGSAGSQRYAAGSYQQREAMAEAYATLDYVATSAEEQRDLQREQVDSTVTLTSSTDRLTSSTDQLTVAVDRNTDARLSSSVSTLPAYQHGGIVDHPTVALIGEAGREYVLPERYLGTLAARINAAQTSGQVAPPVATGPPRGGPASTVVIAETASSAKLTKVLERIETILDSPQAVEMAINLSGQQPPAMTLMQFRDLLLQAMDDARVRVKQMETAAGL